MKTLLLLALLLAAPVQADRIKDIARYAGPRSNQLTGYGLVVGLAGGGDENLEYTVQSIKSAAARMGVALPFGVAPGLKNAAAVMITADLPAFAKPGQRVLIVAGVPFGTPGATNMVRIAFVGSDDIEGV